MKEKQVAESMTGAEHLSLLYCLKQRGRATKNRVEE